MVLLGATFNAVMVVGVVFLLSFWFPMANCGFHMNKYLGIFEHVPLFLNIQTIAQKYCPSIKYSWFRENV